MNIEKGKGYYLRMNTSNGNRFEGRAILKLVAEDGTELCNRPLAIDPDKTWCEYTGQLTATGSDPHARFVIELEGTGTLLLDYVSLFPETFRNRINGLRKDIAQTLEALHPAFVRWPGGCIVEGIDLSNRIEWKKDDRRPQEPSGDLRHVGIQGNDGIRVPRIPAVLRRHRSCRHVRLQCGNRLSGAV